LYSAHALSAISSRLARGALIRPIKERVYA
jgi:hypothetical protein